MVQSHLIVKITHIPIGVKDKQRIYIWNSIVADVNLNSFIDLPNSSTLEDTPSSS